MTRSKGLLLQIAPGDPRPISKQIVDGIRLRIATGELSPGEALPSVRGLAQQLLINPNTVAKAYAELTTERWVEARQGLGLFVAKPQQRLSNAERKRRFDEAVQRFVGEVVTLDIDAEVVQERVAEELAVLSRRTA
jgi:GntR family transcriptional regulator